MNRDYDDSTLARYLSGECTPDEAHAIRQWINENVARQHSFDVMQRAWEASAHQRIPKFDIEQMRGALAVRAHAGESRRSESSVTPRTPFLVQRHRAWAVPAAIAAALIAVAGMYMLPKRTPR